MANRIHAFIERRQHDHATEDGKYTVTTTACGLHAYSTSSPQEVDGVDTALRSVADEVNCKKCLKEFAAAMPNGTRYNSIMDDIMQAKILAAVQAALDDADRSQLGWDKRSLLGTLKSVRERMARAVDTMDILLANAEHAQQRDFLRIASEVIELPTGIAHNLPVSTLLREAASLDHQIKLVVVQVKAEDAAATAASLAGKQVAA